MFFARTENMRQLAHLDSFVSEQLARVNLPVENRLAIKQFIKSYHEIRFNLDETSYIPNFDNYDLGQKTEVVAILLGISLIEAQTFDAEINRKAI